MFSTLKPTLKVSVKIFNQPVSAIALERDDNQSRDYTVSDSKLNASIPSRVFA
ncbi:hypothetical protein VB713_18745 [Anabaena cylindrica UHCC 0172]|uniref:hypothetical protein n=1 Tax=Anabaena cylindrica TaxID=1165 RepID=UPI002B1F1BB9|nr:hypothetical protein [Anabaena cylindrica]MEA5552987.1 hypothetical protein [Anabaena cylindrica UHCC 0172]